VKPSKEPSGWGVAKLVCWIMWRAIFVIALSPTAYAQRVEVGKRDGVVRISSHSKIRTTCHGTGVVVGPRKILTALHIIRGYEVDVFHGDNIVRGKVAEVHLANDWALIELHEYEVPESELVRVRPEPIKDGDPVFAYGYGSLGQLIKPPLCRVNAKRMLDHFEGVAKPIPGDSGGPVLDTNGDLVGVISCSISDAIGWYGIGDLSELRAFIE
jgi:S1-C subfamily serine protease